MEQFSYSRLSIEGHPIKTKIDASVFAMSELESSCDQFDGSMAVFTKIIIDGEIEATEGTDNWQESAYNEIADARRKIIGIHRPFCESFDRRHPAYAELSPRSSE